MLRTIPLALALLALMRVEGAAQTSLWPSNNIPAETSVADTHAYELGVKFQSAANGYITGVRFYKGAGNTGTHVGNLWTLDGNNLASVTFVGETSTGWQQQLFPVPVAIASNTTYVVSFHAPNGGYAFDGGYFSGQGVTNSPLRTLTNEEAGGNGVFALSPASTFPNSSGNGANYWVDVLYVATLGPDTNAPTVSSVSPANGATGVLLAAAVNVVFSEAMAANSISTNTLTLRNAASNLVAATVTYNVATLTATLQPASALTLGQTYTARVKSGVNGVKDLATNALVADYVWTFTATSQLDYSLWNGAVTPVTPSAADPLPYELGVKFQSDVTGYIKGIRFYKGADNTGTHIGNLWTGGGASLASATFTNESATGWQEVRFASPVPISANQTYVASYYAPNGGYAIDSGYFASAGYTSAPLRALQNGVDGGNGVYLQGPSGFPASSFNAANYWVDVLFAPGSVVDSNAPVVTTVSPANGATGVALATAVTVVFNEAMATNTLNTSTLTLVNAASNAVPVAISYNPGTYTATLQPAGQLTLGQTYTARVKGGVNGVKDLATNALASDYVWTFTTISQSASNLWGNGYTPAETSAADPNAYELGMKFQSSLGGVIRGLRFYKGAGNTNTHTGNLWTLGGSNLATMIFTNESASGWQEQMFATPVTIAPNTTYVASYHAPNGGYAVNTGYFTAAGFTNYPLRALADGEAGGNGVFALSAVSTFPSSGGGANYWVDVVYATGNLPPTAGNMSVTILEDKATNLVLQGSDANGPVTYSILVNPTNGTLTGLNVNTGAITYRPNTNYFGADAFTYRVSDGSQFATGRVSVAISPVNDAPTAANFTVVTPEDTSANLTLQGNDVESPVTYAILAAPTSGLVTGLNTNTGAITYQPSTNFFGSDAFTYRVSDGSLYATGLVTMTVTAVDDPAVASNLSLSLPRNTPTNLVLRATDVDSTNQVSDVLPVTVISTPDNWSLAAGATKEAAVAGNDGDTSYLTSGESSGTQQQFALGEPVHIQPGDGIVSVTLRATCKRVSTPSGSYSLAAVLGGNTTSGTTHSTSSSYMDATDTFTTKPGGGAWTQSDVQNLEIRIQNTQSRNIGCTKLDALVNFIGSTNRVYAILAAPAHGTLGLLNTNNGAVTYQPATNYSGLDSFTFTVRAGGVLSTGLVSLAILSTNNAGPVVANPIATQTGGYGTNFNFTFPANTFTDADTPVLTYAASGLPPGIGFTGPTRTFAGVPTASGNYPVKLVATDDSLPPLSATNSFAITIAKASLTLTARNTNKVYGTTRVFAGTEFIASGLTNGDTVTSVTLASAGTNVAATVRTYPITATNAVGTRLTNYNITYVTGTLTVTPAALTVTANSTNKTFGQVLTFAGTEFTSVGLTNSDLISSVVLNSSGAVSNAPAGLYAITSTNASGIGLTNYAIVYAPGTLTVTGAPQPFAITAITVANGAAIITWDSVSNQVYRLQYKGELTDTNWTEIPQDVRATGPKASATNILGGAVQRFYRIK